MLNVPGGITRTHLPLSFESSNIVPVVVLMTLSPTGEARLESYSWRNTSNVHATVNLRIEECEDARITVLSVLEGEEDMSTGETSLHY